MTNLVRAELRKLTTVRTTYGLLAALLALALASASLVIATGDQVGATPLGSAESMGRMLSTPGSDILLVLLGILLVTGEYRHQTATAAFLITPRRGRVLAAKLTAAGLVGIVAAVVSTVAALALALPWLATIGVDTDLASGALALGLLGKAAHLALYAMLGAGIGAVVRNQLAATLGGLFWLYAFEPLFIGGTFPHVVRWLPTGAAIALAHGDLHGTVALPQWAGGLLLLAYALAAAALAARFITYRDLS
jgi:ABC-2 type transport system permease protein